MSEIITTWKHHRYLIPGMLFYFSSFNNRKYIYKAIIKQMPTGHTVIEFLKRSRRKDE
jgi:hypothetical protein